MKKSIFILLLLILCSSSFFIYQKKKQPLVSVVMPIYNRPDLAPRSIESILNQTMKDFEFIIIDDGSVEETKKILKAYAKKDSRIRLIHNPQNRGIAYSRQRGLDAAKGTFVAIMDSDDWSVPDRLEKSLAFMSNHPEVTAMTAGIAFIPKGEFIPEYTIKTPTQYSVGRLPGEFEVELMFYNNFPNASAFFKRDFVKEKQIKYDTNLVAAEDYDFWRQFIFHGANMASVSDVLLYIGRDDLKPQNYYEAMNENSTLIHKKIFSLFFVPTQKELKFKYNTYEKCKILTKIKESNLKNPRIPQIYLENKYNSMCPVNFEKSYYLTHPLNHWDSFIEQTDETKWTRISTKDTGKLVKIDSDKIEIHWDGYPKETFVHQENGEWIFVPKGEIVTLKHINWSDDFIITKDNNGCRVKIKSECAKIKKPSDDTIWIDWVNSLWANEEFKRNDKGFYEFTREIE